MKLLTEVTEHIEYLTELAQSGKKHYYIEGVFLQGEIKNRNGRIYPMSVLDKEAKRYNEQYIDKNRSFGELNHPENPTINLDRVSHIITELKADGTNYLGKAKILTETPNGKIVSALMDEKCMLGVSSRALGSVKDSPRGKIVENLYLSTAADIVSDPSAPDAFVNNNIMERMMEETEWFFDGVDWRKKEVSISAINEMKNWKKEEREAKFLSEFKKLLG